MKFSLKEYFWNLSNIMVADKLLKVAHIICQILLFGYMLLRLIIELGGYYSDIKEGIVILIFTPILSLLLRVVFEFIESIFAIRRNSEVIANSFEGMLDCDDCECEECSDNNECCHCHYEEDSEKAEENKKNQKTRK